MPRNAHGETGAGITLIIFPIVPILIDKYIGNPFLMIPMNRFERKCSCYTSLDVTGFFAWGKNSTYPFLGLQLRNNFLNNHLIMVLDINSTCNNNNVFAVFILFQSLLNKKFRDVRLSYVRSKAVISR